MLRLNEAQKTDNLSDYKRNVVNETLMSCRLHNSMGAGGVVARTKEHSRNVDKKNGVQQGAP